MFVAVTAVAALSAADEVFLCQPLGFDDVSGEKLAADLVEVRGAVGIVGELVVPAAPQRLLVELQAFSGSTIYHRAYATVSEHQSVGPLDGGMIVSHKCVFHRGFILSIDINKY